MKVFQQSLKSEHSHCCGSLLPNQKESFPKGVEQGATAEYLDEAKTIDSLTMMNRVKELQSHGHRIEKKDLKVGDSMMIQYVDKDGTRRRITVTQKGQSYQNLGPASDRDDDAPKEKKPEPEVKRGRGRPVGSKSGARV